MRSDKLNPFGKVWSTTHIIVKVRALFFLFSSSFLLIVWCYFSKCILKHIEHYFGGRQCSSCTSGRSTELKP